MSLRYLAALLVIPSWSVFPDQVFLDTEFFTSSDGEIGLVSPVDIGNVIVDFENEIFYANVNNPHSDPVTVGGIMILRNGCCVSAIEGGAVWPINELIAQAPPGESIQHLASFETITTLMDWRDAEGVFNLESATIILYDAFEDGSDRD